ncbi:unnamed protein product [Sphagnum jensenii]|uniref:Glycosyltransferase n=1 Tax=Sphagnum jensenii TaxID=128206 RepID=A0ABP1A287_9BRYO
MVDGSNMDQFPILLPPSSSSPLPPHVILVSSPLPGHSIPFLQAAKRLVDEGVTITYVSTDDHISQLLKSSSAASRELRSRGVRFVKLRDGFKHLSGSDFHSYVHSLEGERNMIHLLEEVVVELLESSDHLKESGDASSVAAAALQQRSTPCCLLYDMFSTWSQEVADNHKLAKHLLFVSGAMNLCAFSQAQRLREEGILPVAPQNRDVLITDIPGIPPFPARDLPARMKLDPSFSDFLWTFPAYFQSTIILINTFQSLEWRVLNALPWFLQTQTILEIGPLLLETNVQQDDEESEHHPLNKATDEEQDMSILWLNMQPLSSVLYIAFGTYATLSAAQILELAQGLEASNQSFLWVLCTPDQPSDSSSCSRHASGLVLPPGFKERTKGHGLCVSGWVPQKRILQHPATGGFLSHCGWNSTMESICEGIPLLAWPLKGEQHMNCRFLVDTAKLAMEMKEGTDGFVSKQEVERKIRALMEEVEGELIKSNMKEMRSHARQAVAEGGTSKQSLQVYINYLRTLQSP